MELEKQKKSTKSRKISISVALYIIASIIAIAGIILLIDNIVLFGETVSQAAKRYSMVVILKQLVPGQLLPGIFQPIAVYGGTASILFGIGMLNKKVSKCLMLLEKTEVCKDSIKESILEQNIVDKENTETTEQ